MVCLTCFLTSGFLKVYVLSCSSVVVSVGISAFTKKVLFHIPEYLIWGSKAVKRNAKYYDSINEIFRLGNALIIMVQDWKMPDEFPGIHSLNSPARKVLEVCHFRVGSSDFCELITKTLLSLGN